MTAKGSQWRSGLRGHAGIMLAVVDQAIRDARRGHADAVLWLEFDPAGWLETLGAVYDVDTEINWRFFDEGESEATEAVERASFSTGARRLGRTGNDGKGYTETG